MTRSVKSPETCSAGTIWSFMPASASHSVVCAHHEFFLLGSGPERLTPAFLSRAHLFLAEQPGSRYFALYRPNGVLWSLVVCAITVPFINRLLPGRRYEWTNPRAVRPPIDASAAVIAT